MTKKNAGTKMVLNLTSSILHIFLNIIFYIVVILLVVKASQLAYQYAYQVFGSVSVAEKDGKEYKLKIKKKESSMSVAGKLEQNGIIMNRMTFYIRAKLTSQKFKPGTYVVNSSMDYDEIFAVITAAESTE